MIPEATAAHREQMAARFADDGLAGLNDRPRATKQPIYGRTSAFWRFWISRRRRAVPGGRVRCGKSIVQYVWRFLREHNIDLAARKSWCESNDPEFAAKAAGVGRPLH